MPVKLICNKKKFESRKYVDKFCCQMAEEISVGFLIFCEVKIDKNGPDSAAFESIEKISAVLVFTLPQLFLCAFYLA
jgi:hypothetical protein